MCADRLSRGHAGTDGHRRPVPDRVPPRHAQHSRLPGARDPYAGGHPDSHRRLQDRPDAARPAADRPAPLRRARRSGRAGAVRGQHERRPARIHGVGTRSHPGVRRDFQQRHRARVRDDVLDERLPAAAAGRSGRAVRAPGRLRRTRHAAHVRDRAAARLSARAARPSDPGRRSARARRSGRVVPLHRLAGRAAGGPAPDRDQRPPSRQGRTRATWSCSRPGTSPATRRRSAG